MGISLSDVADRNRPYIHSNIYNFMMDTSTMMADFRNGQEIRDVIALYESWRDQLRTYESELYDFCEVGDYKGLNRLLFGEGLASKRLTYIAQEVLRKPSFVAQLVPKIDRSIATAIFNEFDAKPQFVTNAVNEMFQNKNEVSISETIDAIVKAIKDQLGQLGKQDRVSAGEFNAVFKSFKSDIKKWASISVKSKQNNLQEAAKKLLAETLQKQNVLITKPVFLSYFVPAFKNELSYRNTIIFTQVSSNLNQIITELGERIYEDIAGGSGFLSLYSSNLLGKRGEGVLNFSVREIQEVEEGVQLKMEAVTTGNLSEEKIYEQYFKQLGLSKEEAMLRNHNVDTFSGTDNLIKIIGPRGTRFFRVQSKDSALKQLEGKNADYATQHVRMLKEDSVDHTLATLENENIITADEAAKLAYVMANVVWFQIKGSYRIGSSHLTKVTQSTGSSNVSSGIEYINTILSTHIKDLIGITVKEGAPMELHLNATNIFYFLGARTLFPVSEVLDQVVKRLKDLENKLFSIRYILNTKSVSSSFVWTSARDFFAEKQRNFSRDSLYSSEVLEVGKTQGGAIMSSLTGHLNFDFQIAEILKISSYVF